MYPKNYEKELYSDYYDQCPYTSTEKYRNLTSTIESESQLCYCNTNDGKCLLCLCLSRPEKAGKL